MDGDDILDYGRGFWQGDRLQSGKRIDTLRAQNIPHNARVIRCNIFHGEKAPGVLNDDRIVKAATPVLRQLLEILLKQREPSTTGIGT